MLVMYVLTGELAMLTDIDTFLIGVLGGIISSISIFSVMYFHFHQAFKDYFYNKEHYVTVLTVKKLCAEVSALKEQLKHMNLDHYENIMEDEYK